ncbi:MAG: sulfurtransferase-like selenium metabolism protein YedF [Deltaproteobacteria bacterium]|nr:sulfurtransferase-like selenium metabolism protein YedF [Deltaproteobacteria bacterium]
MTELIDCRGLACPEPVLRTKEALERKSQGLVSVLVDNDASRENVRRFAESRGAAVTITAETGGWRLDLRTGDAHPVKAEENRRELSSSTALLVLSDQIGPEPELGRILIRAFLATLSSAASRPSKLMFLNRGIHLTTAGSEVVDVLRELEKVGIEILSCGTCLDFFGKREQLVVGRISNMYDTVETLTGPSKVVTVG